MSFNLPSIFRFAGAAGLPPDPSTQRTPEQTGFHTVRTPAGDFIDVPYNPDQGLFIGMSDRADPIYSTDPDEIGRWESAQDRRGRQAAITIATMIAGGAALFGGAGAGAGTGAAGGTVGAGASGLTGITLPASVAPYGTLTAASMGTGAAGAATAGAGGGFLSNLGSLFGGGGSGGGTFNFSSIFGGGGGAAGGNSMAWIPLAAQGAQTLLGMRGAKKARRAREAAIAEARGVQQGALDQTMGMFQPYADAGGSALRRMLGMQGLEGGEAYDIKQDPSYQFRLDESMRALEGSAAARGGLLSGGFSRQALQLAGNFASQEYSNIYNRLAGMVNLGMGATTQQANALSGYSSNISNLIMGRGEARAVGSAEKYNQLMDLAGSAGDFFGGRGGNTSGGKVMNPGDFP